MFKRARNIAGLSREDASSRLHIGNRTLNNYEHYLTTVPPEVAISMGEIYTDPTLTAKYCSDYCPIGQIYAHSVPEAINLCSAVLGLLNEYNEVDRIRPQLISIAQDGVIDESELPTFKSILDDLMDLEKKIEEIKLFAASMISIPELMEKRKRPLVAAK